MLPLDTIPALVEIKVCIVASLGLLMCKKGLPERCEMLLTGAQCLHFADAASALSMRSPAWCHWPLASANSLMPPSNAAEPS